VVIDPVRDPDGRLLGYAKITRDLTERKRSQEALDAAREQFFQSQKMESLGKLSGGVAHDFNNLLAAILSSLDLARRRLGEGRDVSGLLENATRAAERGAELTQRMLAFARRQELKLESVNLTASLAEMSELLVRTIGPNYVINTQFPLILPKVRADRNQLELALVNLVVNARDAMPGGGAILISATLEQEKTGPGERFVCLSITDEGEGMERDVLARAAEPFFTTKGIGKGTGLGLSMVHGMIEQCGGRLELKSAPGKGTTVTMWLPIAEAGLDKAPARAARAEAYRAVRPLTILAVDDDPIVLVNTAAMLADMGHQVHPAASGSMALTLLQNLPVDLLITDYAMPGMTGAELIRRARLLRPDLPAIVVSGFAELDEGVVLEAPRLAKPFRQHQLAAKIAECMHDVPGAAPVVKAAGAG
jgi:nitrogen-specific signal transduction histidine kinase